MTYIQDEEKKWVQNGTVDDIGYMMHSGIYSTTWGCIKMSDADVADLAKYVDAANANGGKARPAPQILIH